MSQLVSSQGDSEFALLEEIQLSSMLQDQAGSSGKVAKVQQTVTLAGERIVARVNITMPPGHLFRSQVSLLAGHYLVVGQTGFDARQLLGFAGQFEVSLVATALFPDAEAGDDLTLYYAMMAELVG